MKKGSYKALIIVVIVLLAIFLLVKFISKQISQSPSPKCGCIVEGKLYPKDKEGNTLCPEEQCDAGSKCTISVKGATGPGGLQQYILKEGKCGRL